MYEADGLGSVRGLLDVTGARTDTYTYEAFGSTVSTIGTDANPYRFAGERLVDSVGLYQNRARWMDTRTGRFVSVDPGEGDDADPLSLHRYLYAGNGPLNGTDPSGFETMSELQVSQLIQSDLATLAAKAGNVINFVHKVESTLDLLMGLMNTLDFVSGLSLGDLSATWPLKAPKIDFSDAAEKFVVEAKTAVGLGLTNWTAGYMKTRYVRGNKLTGYVIYLPTIGRFPSKIVPTGVKVGDVGVSFGLGGPGGKYGSVGGLGVIMGGERQLYRMDFRPFDLKHGGASGISGNEIAPVWKSGPYHFHAYNWNGGPR